MRNPMPLDEQDARMLREVLAETPDEDEETRYNARAFRSMLNENRALTPAQKWWVRGVHERIIGTPNYENLISTGRAPRGREVPTPPVLQNLPKRPPGRKE